MEDETSWYKRKWYKIYFLPSTRGKECNSGLFLLFSMLNNNALSIDERVMVKNSAVNINATEKVDENYLLFDDESAHHMFCNKEWLAKICKDMSPTIVSTNGVPYIYRLEGYLPGFELLYYNPHSIADNIFIGLAEE